MSHGDSVTRSRWPRPAHGDHDFDLPEDDQPSEPSPRRPEAVRSLVAAALEAAGAGGIVARFTAPADAALAVVVKVPTAAWVEPVEEAFERLDGRIQVFARDAGSKSAKGNDGNAEVGGHLSSGRSVVGISNSLSAIPRTLLAAADESLELRFDAEVLADAISRFVGKPVATEGFDGLASLDFHDVVAAFRTGSSSAEIYARLRTSAARAGRHRGDRLPRLFDAVEYGGAPMQFARTVCTLFKEFREGRAPWSAVSAQAHGVFAGSTGVGKTYFAQILANELGIPLVATSISEIFASSSTGYLDSVIKRVRETFTSSNGPHAILWDEFDALPSRAALGVDRRSSSFWTPVVSEFLLALDSAVSGERVGQFVWAASNFPERIDSALLRPGRLDRVIRFTAPEPTGIASILRHHLGADLPDLDLAPLSQIAVGRSHAEVAAFVKRARTAALLAERPLEHRDLVDAIAPRLDADEATLRWVARHEAGHVVVALALGVDEVVAASVGVGDGLGQTLMRQRRGIETRSTIEDRVCVSLGGRAAEALLYGGECSANAESDLAAATEAIAGLYVSKGLAGGLAHLGDEKTAAALLRADRTLRDAVNEDLARLQARATEIVAGHRDALEAIAAALTDRRHLTGDQVRAIYETSTARSATSAVA